MSKAKKTKASKEYSRIHNYRKLSDTFNRINNKEKPSYKDSQKRIYDDNYKEYIRQLKDE